MKVLSTPGMMIKQRVNRASRSLKLFFLFDMESKLMMMEAFMQLGWARMIIRRPFPKLSRVLGRPMQETPMTGREQDLAKLKKISSIIGLASKHTLWQSQCLVRALAAMRMLERRRIESTLYLGTAKDEKGELIAHAWLRSGSYYISGAEEMKRFTVVHTFSNSLYRSRETIS